MPARGLRILYRDNPLDFSAVSSLFSERFPNVMIDDNSIARGSANGIRLADM
jgi:hypothetical protein